MIGRVNFMCLCFGCRGGCVSEYGVLLVFIVVYEFWEIMWRFFKYKKDV